jgi:hypothetical protein
MIERTAVSFASCLRIRRRDSKKPRGLRFGPDGKLYCAAQDEVVAFDFATGKCLGSVVSLPRLNGQAVIFFG